MSGPRASFGHLEQSFPHDPLSCVLVEYDPEGDRVLASSVSAGGGKTLMWCHDWRHVNACLNPHQPGRPEDPADTLAIEKCSQHLRSFSHDMMRKLMHLKTRTVLAKIGRSHKAEQVKWVRTSKEGSVTAPSRPMPRGKQRHFLTRGRTFAQTRPSAESIVKDKVEPEKTRSRPPTNTGGRVDVDSTCVFLTDAGGSFENDAASAGATVSVAGIEAHAVSGMDEHVFKKFTPSPQVGEPVFKRYTPAPKKEVSHASEPLILADTANQHCYTPRRGEGGDSATLEAVSEEDVDRATSIPAATPAFSATASGTATLGGTASVTGSILSSASREGSEQNVDVEVQRGDEDAKAGSPETDRRDCASSRTSDHSGRYSVSSDAVTSRPSTTVSNAVRSPRTARSSRSAARSAKKIVTPGRGEAAPEKLFENHREMSGLAESIDKASMRYGLDELGTQRGYEILNTDEELKHAIGLNGKSIGFKLFMNPFDESTPLNHSDIAKWSARHGGPTSEHKKNGPRSHTLETPHAGSPPETGTERQIIPQGRIDKYRSKERDCKTMSLRSAPKLNTLAGWADDVELPHRRFPGSYSNYITAMGANVSFKKGLTMPEHPIIPIVADQDSIPPPNQPLADGGKNRISGAAAARSAINQVDEMNIKALGSSASALPMMSPISALPMMSPVLAVSSGAGAEQKTQMDEDQQTDQQSDYQMQNYGIRGKNIAEKVPKQWRADPGGHLPHRLKMDGRDFALAGLPAAKQYQTVNDAIAARTDAAEHSEAHKEQQETNCIADGSHAQANGDGEHQRPSTRERSSKIRSNAEGRYNDLLPLNNKLDFKIFGFSAQEAFVFTPSNVVSLSGGGSQSGRREGSPRFGRSGSPLGKAQMLSARNNSQSSAPSTPQAAVTPRGPKSAVLNEREQGMQAHILRGGAAPMTPRKSEQGPIVLSLNLERVATGSTSRVRGKEPVAAHLVSGRPASKSPGSAQGGGNASSTAPTLLGRLPTLKDPEPISFTDAQVLMYLFVHGAIASALETMCMGRNSLT